MKKIVLVGAGGHCKVIIDIINSAKEYEIVGITDAEKKPGEMLLGVPILGTDECLSSVFQGGTKHAFVALGALNNFKLRERLYFRLREIGFKLPSLLHSTSLISPYAAIGEGTCVMPGAIINSGAVIGENCIINSGAVIEHDCIVKENTHISPGVCLGGGTHIGANCHIGINSTIIQGINIGNNVTIGGGSVVIRHVESDTVAVGVPAKKIRCR